MSHPHPAGPGPAGETLAWQRVLHLVEVLGVPFGREQSFKMSPGRLVADRLLVGVQRSALPAHSWSEMAAELGMPAPGWALLARDLPRANAVFLATEDTPQQRLCKMYLEFWDVLRARVRGGDASAQLLHLGVKWSSGRPGHYEEARYVCHPLLSVAGVLRRMRAVYPDVEGGQALEAALQLVRHAAARAPKPAFLYLEASEANNPRRSFDVNLYKSGILVRRAQPWLEQAADGLRVPRADLDAQLRTLGELPLGHLSGGCDRRGEEFLSVYAELAPLPYER